MLLRTRNLLLILLSIGFLLIAVGAVFTVEERNNQHGLEVTYSDNEPVSLSVDTSDPMAKFRDERLAVLRERLRLDQDLVLRAPVINDEPVEEEIIEEESQMSEPLYCPSYSLFSGSWPAQNISIEAEGGVWIVYEETIEIGSGSSSGTLPAPNRNVLLTLPQRNTKSGSPHCINSDVIGIAVEGSLIRNSEVGIYSVFNSNTIIGYALDGFPIRGQSSAPTDKCGGRTEGNQYSYFIDPEKETIINCFSASPNQL